MQGTPESQSPDSIPLARELAVFDTKRAEWIKQGHSGKWVVIKEDNILGLYPDVRSGYSAGVKVYGSVPFLVKEIKDKDDIAIIQRTAHRKII
jgi:hypothetical protein